MQYFFFEKYLMEPDSFVYINAILMLISSALFIKDLGPFYISFSHLRHILDRKTSLRKELSVVFMADLTLVELRIYHGNRLIP